MRIPALLLMLSILTVRPVPGQQPPAHGLRAVFERAQNALVLKDYAGAERGFKEVLQLDPRSVAAYSNLGVVYLRTERYDAALRAFLEARKLNPAIPGVDLNLGLTYYHKQDFVKAIPKFSHVLRLQPDNYQA
jgi:tetratricopeptide (TPR) repeat protein